MKRILITGCHGLLGQKLVSLLSRETDYHMLITDVSSTTFLNPLNSKRCDYTQLDITAKSDVKSLIGNYRPEVIINAAAFTDVDECEVERERAWKINVDGVKHLIIGARRIDAKIVHISTDYVFDGKNGSYREDDRPNPVSYYGKTKLASENALRMSGIRYAIVRSMILYGIGKNVRRSFPLWVIDELRNKRPIRVVDDQIGNPTLVDDLAYGILRIVDLNREGIYHIAGSESVSRYLFAMEIARVFGLNPKLVQPIKTVELNQPAPRPLHSNFVILKAETDLGMKPSSIEQGLLIMKRQMENEQTNDVKPETSSQRLRDTNCN